MLYFVINNILGLFSTGEAFELFTADDEIRCRVVNHKKAERLWRTEGLRGPAAPKAATAWPEPSSTASAASAIAKGKKTNSAPSASSSTPSCSGRPATKTPR